jgi:hypothetical protein
MQQVYLRKLSLNRNNGITFAEWKLDTFSVCIAFSEGITGNDFTARCKE